jgi:hypothetical protein
MPMKACIEDWDCATGLLIGCFPFRSDWYH